MYENGNKNKFEFNMPSFNITNVHSKKTTKKKITHDSDGERGFKISGNIIPKLLVVCLFFFIFIFCASRFGKGINKDHSFADFNSSLTYVEKSAISYFKKTSLPKDSGASKTMSFTELVNKGVIDSKKLTNEKDCDFNNSYVKITKNKNGEYILKVSINCNVTIEEKEELFKKL